LGRIVLDIEANGLENPDKIWCIVCKDIDTEETRIFRDVQESPEAFIKFAGTVDTVIGHNILGYDLPVIHRLLIPCGLSSHWDIYSNSTAETKLKVFDTLCMSKLVDYSRLQGHSLDAFGREIGQEKLENKSTLFFKQWSQELEDYCVRDVEINHQVFLKLVADLPDWERSGCLQTEQSFQRVLNALHENGFYFNLNRATGYLETITADLAKLDGDILNAFPARPTAIREIHPKLTKFGTLNRSDFRWIKDGDLSEYNGGPFTRIAWKEFNPSSHKQIVDVLQQAGWHPTDKTKTHIETEREINRLKYSHSPTKELDLNTLNGKLETLKVYGYKINEENLSTLPSSSPAPARLLAKRIVLESRRRTLTEWCDLVQPDGRIHGKFYGIGAWTHRMAHQEPNTANIPNEFREDGSKKFFGKELRSLWCAPKKRLLVGVDAEGIQLRIFAHYVNDPELTQSLVDGRKDNKTDPHSLNQRVLGEICKTRAAAKRFLYALLLGGGVGKFAEILDCSQEQAREAVDKFNERYPGFNVLKRERFPADAKAGYFTGLDGRKVLIPGNTVGDRRHLCMSGYLQNGEAIVMKRATLKWFDKLAGMDCKLVNFVHDEWQTETPNNMEVALEIAKMQADSLRIVGEELGLNCPLAGSYWNEDKKDYTIGTNWYVTH